jgi:hypothetical protein
MTLRAELQRLRVALEGLWVRVAVPLLVLPGVLAGRCDHDPTRDGTCPEAPAVAVAVYSDGSTRP